MAGSNNINPGENLLRTMGSISQEQEKPNSLGAHLATMPNLGKKLPIERQKQLDNVFDKTLTQAKYINEHKVSVPVEDKVKKVTGALDSLSKAAQTAKTFMQRVYLVVNIGLYLIKNIIHVSSALLLVTIGTGLAIKYSLILGTIAMAVGLCVGAKLVYDYLKDNNSKLLEYLNNMKSDFKMYRELAVKQNEVIDNIEDRINDLKKSNEKNIQLIEKSQQNIKELSEDVDFSEDKNNYNEALKAINDKIETASEETRVANQNAKEANQKASNFVKEAEGIRQEAQALAKKLNEILDELRGAAENGSLFDNLAIDKEAIDNEVKAINLQIEAKEKALAENLELAEKQNEIVAQQNEIVKKGLDEISDLNKQKDNIHREYQGKLEDKLVYVQKELKEYQAFLVKQKEAREGELKQITGLQGQVEGLKKLNKAKDQIIKNAEANLEKAKDEVNKANINHIKDLIVVFGFVIVTGGSTLGAIGGFGAYKGLQSVFGAKDVSQDVKIETAKLIDDETAEHALVSEDLVANFYTQSTGVFNWLRGKSSTTKGMLRVKLAEDKFFVCEFDLNTKGGHAISTEAVIELDKQMKEHCSKEKRLNIISQLEDAYIRRSENETHKGLILPNIMQAL